MERHEEFIKEWLSERSGTAIADIDLSVNIFERGYIDSLGIFQFFLDVETEFGVRFSEADMGDLRLSTVKGLVELIGEKD